MENILSEQDLKELKQFSIEQWLLEFEPLKFQDVLREDLGLEYLILNSNGHKDNQLIKEIAEFKYVFTTFKKYCYELVAEIYRYKLYTTKEKTKLTVIFNTIKTIDYLNEKLHLCIPRLRGGKVLTPKKVSDLKLSIFNEFNRIVFPAKRFRQPQKQLKYNLIKERFSSLTYRIESYLRIEIDKANNDIAFLLSNIENHDSQQRPTIGEKIIFENNLSFVDSD